MGLWDKVQKELDRAGHVAREALDEGKLRIELFRVRQQADKAAQALGYALHRARQENRELEAEALTRLHETLAGHEAEAKRIEAQLAEAKEKGDSGEATGAEAPSEPAAEATTEGEPPASA